MHDLRALRVLDERDFINALNDSVPIKSGMKERSNLVPKQSFVHPLVINSGYMRDSNSYAPLMLGSHLVDDVESHIDFPPQLECLVWRVDGYKRAYRIEGGKVAVPNDSNKMDTDGPPSYILAGALSRFVRRRMRTGKTDTTGLRARSQVSSAASTRGGTETDIGLTILCLIM